MSDDNYALTENRFNAPLKKFVKAKSKRRKYDEVYQKNKFKYYSQISWTLLKKKIKGGFKSNLLNILIYSVGFFLLRKVGLGEYLQNIFKGLIDKYYGKSTKEELLIVTG